MISCDFYIRYLTNCYLILTEQQIGKPEFDPETSEKRQLQELQHGRLAMLGIFGFLCADTIPGSVPALSGIASPYSGDPMVPFEGQFSYF